jgi:HK97 family phage portal protein
VAVSEQTALNYSAVWSAVTLIAGDVASLPLILYKRLPGGGRERFLQHPLYRLLHDEPNSEMSSLTFREVLTAHLLTWGNAYAEIERDIAGRPVALWPLTPDRVTPLRDPSGALVYRVNNPGKADSMLDPGRVLHVSGLGFDGLMGYSVVAKARESLGLGVAAERFGATFFGNGATFGGILSHPSKLSDVALKHLKESIEARHAGVDKAHKFLMLEEGMSYANIGIPPDDAQFLETRQFQIEEVARWFNVPPHKIGYLKYGTYSNIEQQAIDYVTGTLRRWLVRWEQEVTRKLIAPSERRQQYVEHLVDALLRGDTASRYSAYATARQWGWLSVDDIRERENMNPLPDGSGQMYLVPTNMLPADLLREQAEADLAKKVADAKNAENPPPPPPPVEGEDDGMQEEEGMTEDDEDDSEEQNAQERLLAFLTAELETARTSAREAHARLEQVVTGEDVRTKEVEAGLLDAIHERDRVVSDLTAKLSLLEELHARRFPSVEDIAAPIVTAVHASQDALGSQLTLDGQRIEELSARITLLPGELPPPPPPLDPDVIIKPVVVRLEEAHADLRADLAHVKHQLTDEAIGNVVRTATVVDQIKADLDQRPVPEPVDLGPVVETVKSLVAEEARVASERYDTAQAQSYDLHVEVAKLVERLGAVEARVAQTPEIEWPKDLATTSHLRAIAASLKDATEAAVTAAVGRVSDELAAEDARALKAKAAQDARVAAAHRTLIVDAMNRVLRVETDRARRASTPEKLERWLAQFYATHADVATAVLLPAVRAHLAWIGSEADPEVLTRSFVDAHVAQSVKELRMALASEPEEIPGAVHRTLARWEAERATTMADAILQEGVRHG